MVQLDRSGPSPKLVVNAVEAARVRHIFELYLSKGAVGRQLGRHPVKTAGCDNSSQIV